MDFSYTGGGDDIDHGCR